MLQLSTDKNRKDVKKEFSRIFNIYVHDFGAPKHVYLKLKMKNIPFLNMRHTHLKSHLLLYIGRHYL